MFFQWDGDDLLLNIRVQPRASSDGFAERMGDQIKLRITTAPVAGRANRHLVAYLARIFKVAKADVRIIAGETSRNKRLRIHRPRRWPEIISDPP